MKHTHKKQLGVLRSICVLLITFFSLQLAWANEQTAPSFSDVPENHRYFDALESLKKRNIISGYSDGTFKPDATINRAEAMKLVMLGLHVWRGEEFVELDTFGRPVNETEEPSTEESNGENPESTETSDTPTPQPQLFSDVHDEWFAPYVKTARVMGIANGYEDGTFKPGDNINKAESLKIVLLTFTEGVEFSEPGKNPFPDVPFNAWYAAYVQYGKDKIVIEPDQFGKFNGGTDITRGEFADIIYRLMYISEQNLDQFDPSLFWEVFDRSSQGYTLKLPPQWEMFEERNDHPASGSEVRTVFWHKDDTNKQRTYMREFPNSATAEIVVPEEQVDKNKFFTEIRTSFGSNALVIETLTNDMPTLVVESDNGVEHILDSYVYMPDGRMASIFGTYGNGPLAYKNSFYLRKIRENFRYVEHSDIDDITLEEVLTTARQNIQIDGKGRDILQMFDDLVIIETDTIGVGTGPVDYYFSAKGDVTLKYERSFNVILDIEDGRTSGF